MSRLPKVPREVAESICGDLSDGAYFAMMSEFGHDPWDFSDDEPEAEPLPHRTCRRCKRTFDTKRARNQHERDKHAMHGGPKLAPRNQTPTRATP